MTVNRRHWQAFAMAFSVETLLIIGTLVWAGQQLAPIVRDVVSLTLELAPEPLIEKKQAPVEPVKLNRAQKTKPSNTPPESVSPPKVQSALSDAPQPPPTRSEPAATTAPATQAPAVAAPAAPAAPDPALAYNAKLAAAVQAAFEVPGSAKALSFKGRARMEFSLHDGKVSAIRVIQSSGLSAVDRAAIKAVESASYPLPPAALQNKDGVYQIWVACY